MADIHLYLLGASRVECDGALVEFDTRKATALLAYLAVTGSAHSRDALATLLWSEYSQTSARAALRRTLSTIKASLGMQPLLVSREQVSLDDSQPLWSDVAAFSAALESWKQHGHPAGVACSRCIPDLQAAVSLYRDDFLAGFSLRDSPAFDDWQFFQAEQYRRALAVALERLISLLQAQGEFGAAIGYAQKWLALDPLHEPAHRQLMSLFAWNGERNAALRQYRECVRILDQELGVEPLDETTHLYETIKENRLPAPAITPPVAAASLEEAPRVTPEAPTPAGMRSVPPLVGRRDELAQMHDAYRSINVDGGWVAIEGEAGVGKTRLAETFLAGARENGALVLTARCYEGESQLAYAPFVNSLRELLNVNPSALQSLPDLTLSEAARLVPDLLRQRPGIPAPLPLSDAASQTRFFEATSQVILAASSGPQAGILFIDDIQWADDASLDLFTYLVRRLQGRRLFILTTWRSADAGEGHRLRQLFGEAKRAGRARLIALERFSRDEVESLMALQRPQAGALPGDLLNRLFIETEGLPFFVVEYLASMPAAAGDDWAIPGSVRDLLMSRLSRLDEIAWQTIQAAAVIGRSFDFDTLREVSGRSEEETIDALEAMLAQRLAQDISPAENPGEAAFDARLAYDFSHEKLRSVVYERISLARRRLLHQRVAASLAGRARHQLDPVAGQVAYHLERAGLPREAAQYHLLAGDHARRLFANREAMSHYLAALKQGHPEAARLNEAIGELHTLAGEYQEALDRFLSVIADENLPTADCARMEQKIGDVYYRRGERERADQHFENAMTLLRALGDNARLARLYADWSRNAHNQAQPERALKLANRALHLAQTAGDLPATAHAENIMGVLARSRGDLADALAHIQRSLALSRQIGDMPATIAALNNLALVWGDQNDPRQAITAAEQALSLCAQIGDRHREAALHNNLADLFHAAGEPEHALEHLRAAVTLFSEIGVSAGESQPEIWKLTDW